MLILWVIWKGVAREQCELLLKALILTNSHRRTNRPEANTSLFAIYSRSVSFLKVFFYLFLFFVHSCAHTTRSIQGRSTRHNLVLNFPSLPQLEHGISLFQITSPEAVDEMFDYLHRIVDTIAQSFATENVDVRHRPTANLANPSKSTTSMNEDEDGSDAFEDATGNYDKSRINWPQNSKAQQETVPLVVVWLEIYISIGIADLHFHSTYHWRARNLFDPWARNLFDPWNISGSWWRIDHIKLLSDSPGVLCFPPWVGAEAPAQNAIG